MDDIIRPKKQPLLDVDKTKNVQEGKLSMEDNEPKFVPPEELADEDIMEAAKNEDNNEDITPLLNSKNPRKFRIKMPKGKKQWAIFIVILSLIMVGAVGTYWFLIRNESKPAAVTSEPVKKVTPKPTTEISKFSGLAVPIGTNLKPVTAVMIENSAEARPQSGLKDANIVFEAIAEGGITRFCALYQDTTPDYVGPIRSVRPYYLDWLWPFDASVAHVGGAPKALSDIKSLGIKDLDQFANGGSYERIKSRYAPHNVYTSISKLNELESKKGYTSANFDGFTRKKESKATTPTAKTVNLDISSFLYNVQYSYDTTTNSYLRSEGGAIHKDEKSGIQLAPKVVIAIVMSRGIDSDGQHTEYSTVGSGQMYVFQDGTVTQGTWTKTSRQAQWVFKDTTDKVLALNPGQTWISIVDSSNSVTYTP